MNDVVFRNSDYEQPSKEALHRRPSSSSAASGTTSANNTPTRRRRKSFGGGGGGGSRRTLSSEAEAARAKRDRRIERAVESAVLRRAEREARKTGTDPEDVARRLRRQQEEDARWREMEEAKRRISRDRTKRERMHSRAAHEAAAAGSVAASVASGGGGDGAAGRYSSARSVDTSTTYASTYRSSSRAVGRSGASGGEPALSGWLDKRKERKSGTSTRTGSDRRSASARLERRVASSVPSAHRSSASIASNGNRRPKSALRTSSSASRTSLHRSSSRGSRGEAQYNYDDAGTVASAATFNTRDTQSISDKMRALSFHPKPSDHDIRDTGRSRGRDDRSVRSSRSTRSDRSKREGGVATTSSSTRRRDRAKSSRSAGGLDRSSHSASSLRSAKSSRSRRSASGDDEISVRSSRSNRSLRDASTHSNGRSQRRSSRSKKRRDDEDDAASVKSSKSIRSRLSRKGNRKSKKKDGHESDDVSVKSSRSKASVSRSVRSLISKSGKHDKDKDAADDNKSVRSKDNVKITRHASRHRSRADTNDSQDILRDQTDLEQEVIKLKLLIANARTEEEEERHHARRVANVNDRLRSLHEEQKSRAKRAKDDVHRLVTELERMRKLKARVAPQVQQDRIKAWQNRRRPSADGGGGRGNLTPTRFSRRQSGARRSEASGASVSSFSVGNSIGDSLVSVHSLFERVERGLAGLEQETVVTLNTTSETSSSMNNRNGY